MKVKIKRLSPESKIPSYSKQGDAGLDLTATSKKFDEHGNAVYGTGLAIEIPQGYVGLLFPRSSNTNKDLILGNSVGVLDSGFRGEITFKFKASIRQYDLKSLVKLLFKKDNQKLTVMNDMRNTYNIGDRIGQLIIMPYPTIEFEETNELSESERGTGGYGSTGN